MGSGAVTIFRVWRLDHIQGLVPSLYSGFGAMTIFRVGALLFPQSHLLSNIFGGNCPFELQDVT